MKINTRTAAGTADIVALGLFEGEKDSRLSKLLASKRFTGKNGEVVFVPAPVLKSARSALLIGLGPREKFSLEVVRRAASKLLVYSRHFQHRHLRFDLDSFRHRHSLGDVAAAAAEGLRLSSYTFSKYKSKHKSAPAVDSVDLVTSSKSAVPEIQKSVSGAEVISESVYFTRDIANEPANVMTPVKLAQAARDMARKNNLKCRIYGRDEIRRLKMGGVLAVSQGSVHPPQFVVLENKARTAVRPIVLVGKGVTFDTGGISIKPSHDMDKMKFDMCGAAAVIGVLRAVSRLKLPVHVVGITPLVENMPGSTAQRPGDIIRCLNGKTVEVLNTDAEGRLILADALSYAARFKPKALIDVATLTGACAATFADQAIGLMGTDPALVQRIRAAGEKAGERCWELPLWDEYFDLIKASYADVQNISKKYAGTITAGLFLKEFADHTSSWAHLDIAGTAWNEAGPKPLSPIGATGVGVRLLVEVLKSYC